jgi:hypothetical protein
MKADRCLCRAQRVDMIPIPFRLGAQGQTKSNPVRLMDIMSPDFRPRKFHPILSARMMGVSSSVPETRSLVTSG